MGGACIAAKKKNCVGGACKAAKKKNCVGGACKAAKFVWVELVKLNLHLEVLF